MSSPSPAPNPSTIFVAWLADHQADDEQAFDTLVQDHADHAVELVRLRADWMRGQAAVDHAPLSKRLQAQFGENVDPEVSLRGSDECPESFSSEVLERLSGRSASFGRYQLKGEIARGGMGAIVKVWDEDLRRHLAMKVILGRASAPSTGATPPVDATKVARFLEEAQVTGQLDHPGIVPVHELGLDPDGRVYFTMKLVRGQTLKHIFDLVAEGKEGWTQTKALGVLLKVCEAMSYAHDKGVIHRDLKPANIMVGKFGEVHVMDWGLARILDKKDAKDIRIREERAQTSSSLRTEREAHRGETPDSPLYTMDGDVVGTPAYMSPEQARGDLAAVGPRSDVYSLGCILYHLLAKYPPYASPHVQANIYAIWHRVQEGPPISIDTLDRQSPAALRAIVEKAMAREITTRYDTMQALREDLQLFLDEGGAEAYRPGLIQRAVHEWGRTAAAAKWGVGLFALSIAIPTLAYLAQPRLGPPTSLFALLGTGSFFFLALLLFAVGLGDPRKSRLIPLASLSMVLVGLVVSGTALAVYFGAQFWTAAKAIGPPDADPRRDDLNAWAPQSPHTGLQWIELEFSPPFRANGLRIYEVNVAGGVVKILAYDREDTETVVWNGKDPTEVPGVFAVSFELTKMPICRVRIVIDTDLHDGWQEIDAVELLGDGQQAWASSARASSSFGRE
jgi:serine/threonine protein kinase